MGGASLSCLRLSLAPLLICDIGGSSSLFFALFSLSSLLCASVSLWFKTLQLQMIHELRDQDDARRFLLQGLWLQRVVPVRRAGGVGPVLEWALEVASEGGPLPPVGFVAD